MKTWTPQAASRLEAYLLASSEQKGLAGAPATEYRNELRREIFDAAEEELPEIINLKVFEAMLARIDPDFLTDEISRTRLLGIPRSGRSDFLIWSGAVLLPVLVLVFEVVTSACANLLFDPMPTLWHLLLIALVPVANAWLLTTGAGARDEWKGAAAGASLIVAGFYGVLFLPVVPVSLLALLIVGAGLLSLSPVLAWIASWRIGRRLRRESAHPARFRTGWWLGAVGVLLAFILLEAPSLWTRANLSQALAGGRGSAAAVDRLRRYHSERTLLAACYEASRGGGKGIPEWIDAGWQTGLDRGRMTAGTVAAEAKARDVFFRVTGKPFNSVPPPAPGALRIAGRNDPWAGAAFDGHLGGDVVGIRLRDLDLKESRFDGHVDSVSRIGYGEWTMRFQNGNFDPQEARCQVKLPPGGRVSRLTLWVDGEPREAAFNAVSKVKAAYKEVAVRQRRDPVLVTMTGPDTVLVQCFPVPAGGEMKIRFGVTAALDGDRWELPRILERNFGTVDAIDHAVWMQADRGFRLCGMKSPLLSVADGDRKSLASALPVTVAMAGGVTLKMDALAFPPPVVWCEDSFAEEAQRILVREPVTRKIPGLGKVVLVIDGSLALAPMKARLMKALDAGAIGILADDSALKVDRDALANYEFSAGRDNEPALREAVRIAKENGGLPIVWVHGPQSVKLAQPEALLQSLERGSAPPVIYSVEGAPGPNRLAEAIYPTGILKRGPDLFDSSMEFSGFLKSLREGREVTEWVWHREAAGGTPEGEKVWDQLARWWAASEVDDSPTLARYQLVTPVSGAVVLETEEQFANAGLAAIDANSAPQIPGVPEASVSFLVMLAAAAAMLRRKRTE